MTCKYCGKENRDDAKICQRCGKELQATEKAQTSRNNRQKGSKPGNRSTVSVVASLKKQLPLILMAVVVLALLLGFVGTLRGCSAASAAKKAATAAAEAQTAAAAAQAKADQNAAALQQALGRIEELESAETVAAPTKPNTVPAEPDKTVHRYPATDPVVTLNVAVGKDGKVMELSYADANGASIRLEPGLAGIPFSFVLNDTDKMVSYDSNVDICANCTAEANKGSVKIEYCWQSLSSADADWVARTDKTDPCLTVSPGYWYSHKSQYRCEIVLTVLDTTGKETDRVSVFTNAADYPGWVAYAEAHANEHDVFIQWSDMMKTYE